MFPLYDHSVYCGYYNNKLMKILEKFKPLKHGGREAQKATSHIENQKEDSMFVEKEKINFIWFQKIPFFYDKKFMKNLKKYKNEIN